MGSCERRLPLFLHFLQRKKAKVILAKTRPTMTVEYATCNVVLSSFIPSTRNQAKQKLKNKKETF